MMIGMMMITVPVVPISEEEDTEKHQSEKFEDYSILL
jgi:hypothetical protein